MGKYNEKLKISTQKYIKENYDKFTTYVPKGHKDELKEYAASLGISLNQLVTTLLDKELYERNLEKEKQ